MGAMTRLQAVNQILLGAGEAIVADLDNQSGLDTTMAEFLLDEYTGDYQLRGLANNQYVTNLTVDPTTNKVVLPQGVISLNFGTYLTNEDGYPIRVSIKTDGSSDILWNVTDQSSDWSAYSNETLKAELIIEIPFEDMDTPMQRAVTASAARRYQMLTQGDEGMDAYLAQDEQIYGSIGKARDIISRNRSIYDGQSPTAKRAIVRGNSTAINPNFRYWRGTSS